NSRRNDVSFGFSPALSCRRHSASAQLYAKRAVPEARAKYRGCAVVGSSAILSASSIDGPLLGDPPGVEQDGALPHVVHRGQQTAYLCVGHIPRATSISECRTGHAQCAGTTKGSPASAAFHFRYQPTRSSEN